MTTKVRCRKCGDPFEPYHYGYGAGDFCPECIGPISDACVKARQDSFITFLNDGHSRDEADRRARLFASEVESERAKRGR